VFYKIDIDRILQQEKRGNDLAAGEYTPQNHLLRKINRIINAQRRLYPELSDADVLNILRSVSMRY